MELLAEISDKDLGIKKGLDTGTTRVKHWDKDITRYYRGAVRAVVLNAKKEILLIHAAKEGYYKLPGGGIGPSEEKKDALRREVAEEAGFKIVVKKPVGLVIEHRSRFDTTQISYCYLARLKGEQGRTRLEEYEKQAGFEPEWWGARKALNLVKNGNRASYLARFVIKRDAIFIKAAIGLL